MRGFLGGVSIGAIVAVAGAAGLSLMMPLAERPEVKAEAPVGADLPETGGQSLTPVSRRDADIAEAAPSAPADPEQTGGDLSALDSSVTDPGDRPVVKDQTSDLTNPQALGETPEIVPAGDAPVAENAAAPAPDAPDVETAVTVSQVPGQPPVSQPSPSAVGNQVAVVTEVPDLPDVEKPVSRSSVTTGNAAPSPEDAPVIDTLPAAAPESNAGTGVPEVPADPEVQEQVEETGDQRIAALPQAGTDAASSSPGIGTPVVPLTDRKRSAAVVLPESEVPAAPAIPPIEAFAEAFENADGKPLMSILLIDDGGAVGAEALLDFPYPLSFAVDPSADDAQEKMERYRAAGFEVVLLADFPAGATPVDAETALEVWFAEIPETVAVLEGVDGGIQGNRDLSSQITAVVKSSGHGLITQDRGLNTVQKLAARDGVPSGVVFRDFDGAGQTPTVMRRFLDQAAFRAGQEGAVIMLGRVQPDTISALLLWGLQDRASRVALAPVSASLLLER